MVRYLYYANTKDSTSRLQEIVNSFRLTELFSKSGNAIWCGVNIMVSLTENLISVVVHDPTDNDRIDYINSVFDPIQNNATC